MQVLQWSKCRLDICISTLSTTIRVYSRHIHVREGYTCTIVLTSTLERYIGVVCYTCLEQIIHIKMACPSFLLSKIWTSFIPSYSRQVLDARIETRSPRTIVSIIIVFFAVQLFVSLWVTFFPMISV